MASRDSWIDPDEVTDLAGEIFPEGKRAKPVGDDDDPLPLVEDDDVAAGGAQAAAAGDGDGPGTAERIAERLRAIRVRAERSGLLVGGKAVAPASGVAHANAERVPEPFVLPGGRLVEQVRALVGWLAGGFERVFVLDELGDELVPGDVPAGLRSGAVRLAQSWERSQRWLREEGLAAEVPLAGAALADGKMLSVVGVRCAAGFYCAALVGERPVSPAHAARVREALFLVFG